MTSGHYNRWWLGTVLALCLMQVAMAVITDPYCVFGVIRYPKRNFEPNTRFLKIEYLRRHPEYDAFILGSSRAAYYGADIAERLCPGDQQYFNLSVSLENGAGIRRKLKWLIAHRRVSQAILNLDFDVQSVATDPLDLLRQDHPLVSGTPATVFYGKYLLFQPRILYAFALANLRESQGAPWSFGNVVAPDALYPAQPFLDLSRLYDVTFGALASDLSRSAEARDIVSPIGLEEFRRTIALLDGAGVSRTLIVPPYRVDQFARFQIDGFISWLQETVRVGGTVWDFSGLSSVTGNLDNYVDPVHFRRSVGDRVLQRIFGPDDKSPTAEEFGVRVTAANIDRHAEALRRQHAEANAMAAPRPRAPSRANPEGPE